MPSHPPSNAGFGNTSKAVSLRNSFDEYMQEVYKSPLTPRPDFVHPGPDTPLPSTESLQRYSKRKTQPTPTNYIVVPQLEAFQTRTRTSILIPPVEFTPKAWRHDHGAGFNTPPKLSGKHHIEGRLDMVFPPSHGLREIIISIQWPGYPQYPFETRIRTKDGNITRGELLDRVCGAVLEFAEMKKVSVEKGHAKWMIGERGLDVDRLFIARLLHRGGSYFQPEIWVPRSDNAQP